MTCYPLPNNSKIKESLYHLVWLIKGNDIGDGS